jgi:DinB superfamily
MPIVPDTKSWMWVLERACPECGFDASTMEARDAARYARERAETWEGILARPQVGVRPSGDWWSPLEYGCHVRDVYRLARFRVGLMVGEDEPTFPNWDQDATAVSDDYSSQDPHVVAAELRAEACAFADELDALPASAWERRGRRSDGAWFTVGSFARYVTHDPVHHEADVG